jgi:hypothetical protein
MIHALLYLGIGAAVGTLVVLWIFRSPPGPPTAILTVSTPTPPPPSDREPTYRILFETRAGPATFAVADRLQARRIVGVPTAKKERVIMVAFDADVTTKADAKAVASTLLALAEDLGT